MLTIYGLKNCDTTRKARRWLAEHGYDHRFVDFRDDGIDQRTLAVWLAEIGWETLLNRRSTTWRQLSESQRDDMGTDQALALIAEHPALIKRPVLAHDSGALVGFKPQLYAALLRGRSS